MCEHNKRSRYTTGFHCNDCDTFFSVDSATYRAGEMLSGIWMVLHNINAQRHRDNKTPFDDVAKMKEKIGIGEQHENYEELIRESEVILHKYGMNSESASIVM